MVCETIREIIVRSQDRFKECDAFRYKAGKDEIESKTYNDVKDDSERFSNVLCKLGVDKKHIVIVGMTSYKWIIAFFGTVNSKSVAVPLDVSLPAPEMFELIRRSDAECIVVDEVRKDIIEGVKGECPAVKYVISMQQQNSTEDVLSFDELMQGANAGFETELSKDDLCVIMFTSGTTGKSKGVMLTHGNLAINATSLDMKVPEKSVSLSVLPIHHAYCLGADILKTMENGTVICINDSLMRMAKNIKQFNPDIMLMVPLMIETLGKKIMDAKNVPKEILKKEVFGENLKIIFSGGAYLNPDYIDIFEELGISVLQGYGMTECSPIISTNVSWDIRKQSVGMLLDSYEAKTVDGELLVKGPCVMQGYYKMEKETAEALSDGWLHTGDLGYVEDGYVYLTGRKKNLIITKNGENVSPEELENSLSTNRIVKEVIVREKEGAIEAEIFPDNEYAEAAGIEDINGELQKIIDALNNVNPMYKRIVSLKVRDAEFEKTPSKKIKRY